MQYFQKEASEDLKSVIKWFWMIDSDDVKSTEQKIIPDGYPELIFHYGSAFEICLDDEWEEQGLSLLAGQINHYFYLRNTGPSKMFGIKLQPWAISEYFPIRVQDITNKVIELPIDANEHIAAIKVWAVSDLGFEEKVGMIEQELRRMDLDSHLVEGRIAVQKIIAKNGVVSVSEIVEELGISERSLERYFKSKIGLSPKLYCRIIRLSHIFKLVQEKKKSWAELAYRAGFYDQTHFIKNFKEFTGEDPSKYGFDEANMANFFLK